MPVPPEYLNSDGHLIGCQEYCVDETGVCHGCQTFVGKVPVTKTFCGSGFNPDHYTQFGITYGEYHNCPQGDHEPHVVSYYETVRYGALEKFCMGRNPKTVTSTICISTVFLGLDHNFQRKGPPVLWETMVFPTEGEDEELSTLMSRYSSKEDALQGHRWIEGEVLKILDARRSKTGTL